MRQSGDRAPRTSKRGTRKKMGSSPSGQLATMVNAFVGTLIEFVKMMDRSMAVADAELIRPYDRGADPRLGFANGSLHGIALRQSRRDGGGQRATGAVGVFGGDSRRGKRNRTPIAHEIVDAFGALAVAALDQHR